MQPLSANVAAELGIMLEMQPRRLAKRLRCTSQNADRVQRLILLILVKNLRRSREQNVDDLQQRIHALTQRLARAQQAELAGLFASLNQD
jgi:uncharacterized protein YlxW (UPF0749 family)